MNDVMTPEEYSALLQLGGQNQDLEAQVAQQKLMAEQLRMNEAPQGRMTGRVYTAPHAMELVGGLARNYAAQGQQNKAMQGQQTMNANSQAQNRKIMEAILRGQGQPQSIMPGETGGMPNSMGNPYDMFKYGGGA